MATWKELARLKEQAEKDALDYIRKDNPEYIPPRIILPRFNDWKWEEFFLKKEAKTYAVYVREIETGKRYIVLNTWETNSLYDWYGAIFTRKYLSTVIYHEMLHDKYPEMPHLEVYKKELQYAETIVKTEEELMIIDWIHISMEQYLSSEKKPIL
jgi:hypothetical protein